MDTTVVSENDFIGARIFAAEYLFTFLFCLIWMTRDMCKTGNFNPAIAIGLVMLVGISTVGQFSGGVFNPAILAGLVVVKVISPGQVVYYLIAQLLAAITAGNLGKYLLNRSN